MKNKMKHIKFNVLMSRDYLYYDTPVKLKHKIEGKSYVRFCRNCYKREADIGEPLCKECYDAHYCRNLCGNKWERIGDGGRCPKCSKKWNKLLKELKPFFENLAKY